MSLVLSVLIHGICLFADGTRAAGRQAYERRTWRTVQATAPFIGHCLAHKAQWHNERTIPIYV